MTSRTAGILPGPRTPAGPETFTTPHNPQLETWFLHSSLQLEHAGVVPKQTSICRSFWRLEMLIYGSGISSESLAVVPLAFGGFDYLCWPCGRSMLHCFSHQRYSCYCSLSAAGAVPDLRNNVVEWDLALRRLRSSSRFLDSAVRAARTGSARELAKLQLKLKDVFWHPTFSAVGHAGSGTSLPRSRRASARGLLELLSFHWAMGHETHRVLVTSLLRSLVGRSRTKSPGCLDAESKAAGRVAGDGNQRASAWLGASWSRLGLEIRLGRTLETMSLPR